MQLVHAIGIGLVHCVLAVSVLGQTCGVPIDLLPVAGSGSARAVSADGQIVVGDAGYFTDSEEPNRAVRWLADGTLQILPSDTNRESEAWGVSADGQVVVGWAYDPSYRRRAVRWTSTGGQQDLGTLGGSRSSAYGVSADGSVVVGYASDTGGSWRAFRWTAAGGMQSLGSLPGGGESVARSVSADGSVVVGWAENAQYQTRAFRWTAAGGMQDLGTLGGADSYANGVSADGKVAVGWSYLPGQQERAFRWTAQGGMQDLGAGEYSRAFAASADGLVVVGEAPGGAFRWTPASGVQLLNTAGENFDVALGVSQDGAFVVGEAEEGYQAFRWNQCVHEWMNPAGGSWMTASNWSTNTVPAESDRVRFDLDATYVVSNVPTTVGELTVNRGEVTFNGAADVIATTAGKSMRFTGGRAIFNSPVDVAGDVDVSAGARASIRGFVRGNLVNNGDVTIRPAATATDVNALVSGPSSTLRMALGTPDSGTFSRLFISAESTIDGELILIPTPALRPTAGDQFALIGPRSPYPGPAPSPLCNGRFRSLSGLVIPESNQPVGGQVFIGVDQRDRTAGMPAIFAPGYPGPSPDPQWADVEAITLAVPRRTDGSFISTPVPGRDRLVVMFHGWNADFVSGGSADLQQAADNMAAFADTRLLVNRWDVALADWSQYNAVLLTQYLGAATASYRSAAVGSSLALWMQEKGLGYQQVHAIGHSAGAWASYQLLQVYAPQVGMLTLLDGFVPPSLEATFGAPCPPGYPVETYFDGQDLLATSTSAVLGCAVNYQVTTTNDADLNGNCALVTEDVDGRQYPNIPGLVNCTVAHHAWPKQWYANTVDVALDGAAPCQQRPRAPGFEMSMMFAEYATQPGSSGGCTGPARQLGAVYDLTGAQGVESRLRLQNPGLNPSNVTPGPTGTVSVPAPGTVSMRTGSPVEFTTVQTFTGRATAISFKVTPISESDGRLTLFVNNQLVASWDEQQLRGAIGPGGFTPSGTISIRPQSASPLTLRFVVQPGSAGPTELIVGELQLLGTAACSRADITDIGDTGAGPDGQITVDDIIAFVNAFSDATGCPGTPGVACNRADVFDIGANSAGPDGQLTIDDIIDFVHSFVEGC